MTCGCQRIRRVLGIKREVDDSLFPNGLTIPQKIWHVSLALTMLAVILAMMAMTVLIFGSIIAWLLSIVPTGAVT